MRRLAFLVLLASPGAAAPGAPRRLAGLDQAVASYSVTARPLRQALLSLIAGGLTAGVAIDPSSEPLVTLHAKAETRRRILDALMAQATGYAWAESAGVAVVAPVSVSTASPLAALDRVVGDFSCAGLDVPSAVRVLRASATAAGLPVERTMMPTARQLSFIAARTPPADVVRVSLAGATLRAALNAVVASRPPAWWLALPLPDGTLALLADAVAEPPRRAESSKSGGS